MKDYNTLETRSSELCLPVQSDLATTQAAHTSILPVLCDNPQAEPLYPTNSSTHCPHPSPFYVHVVEKAGSTNSYQDQITFIINWHHCIGGDAPLHLNVILHDCLPLIVFFLRLMLT